MGLLSAACAKMLGAEQPGSSDVPLTENLETTPIPAL
ncbi:hypothetical protein EMIT0P100_80215 [Pseudomonas sp. IT-P100]